MKKQIKNVESKSERKPTLRVEDFIIEDAPAAPVALMQWRKK